MPNRFWNRCLPTFGLLVLCAALAHGDEPPVKIITLGDSITKGVRTGVTEDQTFSSLVEKDLKKEGVTAEVKNVGIGGERTDQALFRLAKEVVARKPKFVVVMYGTNDSFVDKGKDRSRITEDEYRDNLTRIVKELREAGIEPVLMTPPRWGKKAPPDGLGDNPNARLEKYVAICREVAAKTKTPLVDNYARWTEQEKAGVDLSDWTTDQCHPNPKGHEQIANLLAPVVLKLLR